VAVSRCNDAAIVERKLALDPDHDGMIDLKEAQAGATKVFKELDADKDGTVDAKELKGRLSEADFKAADPDNDGTLDEKEYTARSMQNSKLLIPITMVPSISRS